jgi:hypothetical protein
VVELDDGAASRIEAAIAVLAGSMAAVAGRITDLKR